MVQQFQFKFAIPTTNCIEDIVTLKTSGGGRGVRRGVVLKKLNSTIDVSQGGENASTKFSGVSIKLRQSTVSGLDTWLEYPTMNMKYTCLLSSTTTKITKKKYNSSWMSGNEKRSVNITTTSSSYTHSRSDTYALLDSESDTSLIIGRWTFIGFYWESKKIKFGKFNGRTPQLKADIVKFELPLSDGLFLQKNWPESFQCNINYKPYSIQNGLESRTLDLKNWANMNRSTWIAERWLLLMSLYKWPTRKFVATNMLLPNSCSKIRSWT